MAFKITIEETKDVEEISRGAYAVLGKEYIGIEQFNTLTWEERKEYKATEFAQDSSHATGTEYFKNIYGNGPDTSKTVTKTTALYCQLVTDIDLANVIKAVNGLDRNR